MSIKFAEKTTPNARVTPAAGEVKTAVQKVSINPNMKLSQAAVIAEVLPGIVALKVEKPFTPVAGEVYSVPAKRGPKPSGKAKQLMTLRLDPDVIEGFKSTGDGWQARMNEALRNHLKL